MTKKIVCLFILSFSFLHGVIYEVDDLFRLEIESQKLDCNALVLFDVDCTLIAPRDSFLKPCGNNLRRRFFQVLNSEQKAWLQSIIALEGDEELMDPKFPHLIKQLQNQHIPIMGFTALETGVYGKINSVEDWRLNRLNCLGINFSTTFSDKSPIILTEAVSYNGYYPSFKNGVLFTNRQPKGDIFILFLKKIGWQPTKVLFMDDSIEQLKSVEAAATALSIEFIGLHYIASKTRSCNLDHSLGEFQFQTLVEQQKWLRDEEAKKLSSKD